MNEDIIEMAKEAGFAMAWMSHEEHQCIERLVNLAQAAEREACARVCEEHGKVWFERMLLGFQSTLNDAADAIRARGNQC